MTRKAYKTDMTDAQWQILEPLIPPAKPAGHPRTVNMRSCSQRHILCPANRLWVGNVTS
jgi:transposase